MKLKLKDLLKEAPMAPAFPKMKTDAERKAALEPKGFSDDEPSEDPKDVDRLVDKLENTAAIKLAVKRINQKTEVAPAIIAFAKLLDRQMPGALNPSRIQQVLRGLRELG